MKNTRWRDIIISNLVGVAFGVLLISIGFKFISENIRVSIITTIVLIFIVGILMIIIYRNRRNIISSIIGIDANTKEGVEKAAVNFGESILDKDVSKFKKSSKQLSSFLIGYFSEVSFRVWTFRVFIALLAIFGGIITAGLLLKQNELIEAEKNLIKGQNKLIEAENDYIVNLDKPRLGIKYSGVVFKEINNVVEYESAVGILNFGKREATNVKINAVISEFGNNQCKQLFSENLKPVNPVLPNQEVSYPMFFTPSSLENTHYLNIEIL